MNKILLYIIIYFLCNFNLISLEKVPITISGSIGYGHCNIISTNEILSLYTDEELKKVKEFSIGQSQIGKIEELERIPNLEKLSLWACGIKKIENLDKLVNLKDLYLAENLISKIEGLDNLKSLISLDLSQNAIIKLEGYIIF